MKGSGIKSHQRSMELVSDSVGIDSGVVNRVASWWGVSSVESKPGLGVWRGGSCWWGRRIRGAIVGEVFGSWVLCGIATEVGSILSYAVP